MIACVYGGKANPEQIFGMQAYSAMMSEISSVNSKVVSYALDDKVALSAASMFHGQVFNASANGMPKYHLKAVCNLLRIMLHQVRWQLLTKVVNLCVFYI